MIPEPEPKRPEGYELARCCGHCAHGLEVGGDPWESTRGYLGCMRQLSAQEIAQASRLDGYDFNEAMQAAGRHVEPGGTCPQWQPRDEREGRDG